MLSLMSLIDATAVNWGDVATWVTGLATIALFVIGFLQIRIERDARRRRELEAERAGRREQAERISCWVVGRNMQIDPKHENTREMIWVAVLNDSSQPVYRAALSLYSLDSVRRRREDEGKHGGSRDMSHVYVGVVPPGLGYMGLPGVSAIMIREPGVEIAFTDAAGCHWMRSPLGDLSEMPVPAQEYYGAKSASWWPLLLSEPPADLKPY